MMAICRIRVQIRRFDCSFILLFRCRPRWETLNSLWGSAPVYAAKALGAPRYSSPVESTAHAILASLLAAATISTLRGALPSSAVIHGPIASRSRLQRKTTARAPWIRILRKYRFPRLLIPESLALPPGEYSFGTSPIQAANSRPL